jgi:apolipoprotein D and lipocalin family protein
MAGCGSLVGSSGPPLAVVDDLDVNRYAGKWFEIARYPNTFEVGCAGVTAQYLPLEDGRIRVINTCLEGSLDGPSDVQSGIATIPDPKETAKLKVTFFWPFAGDYWVLDLGADYEYAVVGEPSRQFFWILSRTPQLNGDVLDGILDRMPEWGYNPDTLLYTPQAEPEGGDA